MIYFTSVSYSGEAESSFLRQLAALEKQHRKLVKITDEWSKEIRGVYTGEIDIYRKELLVSLKNNQWFPFNSEREFEGITYFPANMDFRFRATFKEFADDGVCAMKFSGGGEQTMFSKRGVTFSNDKGEFSLFVYKRLLPPGSEFEDMNFHFIPFSDETNGNSTYAGGRYLGFDMSLIENNKIELDFNKAYNPWCHYSVDMPCPLPPRENHVPIAIVAGEKSYTRAVAGN